MGTGAVTLGSSRTVTVNASTLTVGGVISDGGNIYSLTKAGPGTLAISGQNTYTGGTVVNGGTLSLAGGGGTGTIRGALAVNSGAFVDFTGWSLGYSGGNDGGGGNSGNIVNAITVNGGTLNSNAASGIAVSSLTMTGGVFSGTALDWYYGLTNNPTVTTNASNTTAVISAGINVRLNGASNNITFNVAQGTTPSGVNLLISGNLLHATAQGTGGIIMAGPGVMQLTGSNTYTGSTTINGGTLLIGSGGTTGSLPAASAIADNSTLAIKRSDNVAQGVIISGSPITGTGGITQMGPGTLTLNALNSYTGPTVIASSVLNAATLADAGQDSAIGEGSYYPGSPADLVINSGTLQYTGASPASTNRLFTVGAGGKAALDASGAPGGTMTVSSGGGSIAYANTAATATLTLTGSGAGVLGAEVDNSGTGSNVTSLVKAGTGSWVLSGPNTYTGATTVSAGALFINGSNAAGSISLAGGATLGGLGSAAGTATVANGGSIQAGYNGAGSLTLAGLSIGTGTIGIANITNYNFSPAVVVTGSNGLKLSGGSSSVTIALSGQAPVGTGSVQLLQYAGAIQVGNSTAFTLNTAGMTGLSSRALFTLSNPSGFIDLNYSVDHPVWSGAGNGVWDTATQSPKNWVLASNAGSPTDFLAGDAVVFDDNAGLNTTVSISGTGDVYPTSVTFNNSFYSYLIQGTHSIAGSATLAVNGGGLVTITNTNSYTGGTTLSNNSTLSFANGALGSTGSIAFAGNATLQWNGSNTQDVSGRLAIGNGVTATIDTQNNNVTFASSFGGGQAGSLNYVGSGTLTMTAPSTFTGSTTISNGTLQLGDGTTGHDGSLTSTVINNNAALVCNLAGSQTYSGAIGGSGNLIKSGSGTLTLSGTNGYYGATTVNGGALSIASANNLPSGSPLTLSGGGALNMTAALTLANNVTVASGQSGTLRMTGPFTAGLSGDYSGTAGTLTLDCSAGINTGFGISSASGPALDRQSKFSAQRARTTFTSPTTTPPTPGSSAARRCR